MALTIGKLRAGLVVAAVVLLAVIAGYLGLARRRMAHYLHDIAEKNGLDISNEGVSFSHTFGANTQFKLHAARQITYQDGKMTLRDVGIELYGAKSNRSDHIHGSEFEYDPKNGVLVGKGDVYIDLAAPASDADKGALKGKTPPKPQGEDDSKIIHVKTSGVTFSEKAGSATTDERVEFIAGGMTGNSVGASYDSKNGVIVLRSAVHLSGLRNDRPVVVTASWAEMDRVGDLVKLAGAKALLQTDDGARTVAADRSVIHMRKDGNPQRIDGEGHVVLTGDGHDASHGVATGDRMQMDLNDDGQPQAGYLAGNVKFTNEVPNRQEDGRSQDLHVAFDAVGRPVHSVLTGDVEMNVQEGTSHRRLNAAKVDMDLGGGGKAPVFVKGAVATGPDGAQLRLLDKSGKDKRLNAASAVRADVLVARFGTEGSRPAGKAKTVKNGIGPPLEGLDGKGRTYVEQIVTDDKGALQSKQTSTGETLKVDFRTEDDGRIEVTRSEQRGGVTMLREVAQKPAGNKTGAARPVAAPAAAKSAAAKTEPEVEHAKANVAVYEADADVVTLTGDVQVQNADSAVFAEKVVSYRESGDSTAEGGVKVSYLQPGSTGEPVHVMAARAVSHKATEVTEFFAGAGAGARAKMWQGGSQVEAPVLDFDQAKRTVVAKDWPGSNGVVVKTVIVDNSQTDGSKPAAMKSDATAKKQGNSGPMRVWSEEMIYTDATRVVEFKGKVRADDAEGEMRAQDVLVYLTAPAPGTPATSAPAPGQTVTLGGRVDHMVATGAVELDQPGRKATGERLTYTASDEVFVLTGTKAAPPKMVDDLQGMTTGAALRFRSGDDSVVVSSGEDAGHVRSETRMKQGAGTKDNSTKEPGKKP